MTLNTPPAEWLSRTPGQNFALIHGLAMAPVFWRLYAPRQVLEHRSACYPLPGHDGWSLPEPGRMLTTDMIVEAYARALERDFGGKPVTLIGHSTGGFVSLLLAAHRPDLVRSVVLMGGFACGRFEGRERFAARLLRIPAVGPRLFCTLFRRWISTREQFRYGSIDCVYDKSCPWENDETLTMIEDVRLRLGQCRPEDIGSLVAWFQRTSLLPQISHVTTPVLNLIGVNDAIVPPSHQLRISRQLPNVQTVLFGNAGHLLMVERQSELNRVFANFISDPWLLRPTGHAAPIGNCDQSSNNRLRPTSPGRSLAARLSGIRQGWFGTKVPQAH